MKMKSMWVGGAVLIVLALFVGFFFMKPKDSYTTAQPDQAASQSEVKCTGDLKTKTLVSNDERIKNLIPLGSKFKVTLGYYKCHPVKRGDLVLYQYSTTADPVVRVVRGVGSDEFQLVQNKSQNNWNIEINGKLLVTDDSKAPYFFGGAAAPMLNLYAKSGKGVLAGGNCIIFSGQPPGYLDSSTLGVVNSADFLGKVEFEKSTELQPTSDSEASAPSNR